MIPIGDPDERATTSRSNFGIIYSIAENGAIFVVAIPAREKNPATFRFEDKLEFPGGSSLKGEDDSDTIKRELGAELQFRQAPISIKSIHHIWGKKKKGDFGKGGGIHTQNFWAVILGESDFRDEREPEYCEPDGAILGIPVKMEILEFVKNSRTKKAHKKAAIRFIRMAANKSGPQTFSLPVDMWRNVARQYALLL